MAISYVGEGNLTEGTSSTTLTVTLPTTQQGDVCYFVFSTNQTIGGSTHTASAGWDELSTRVSGTRRTTVFRKVMGASPDTSVTGTTSTSTNSRRGIVYCLRGNDTTTSEDATTTSTAYTTSTNPNPPSITTVTNGAWVLAIASTTVNMTAEPSGYTNPAYTGTSGGTSVGVSSIEKATAGAEDPGTYTAASGTWAAFTVAVRPAAVVVRSGGRLIGGILTRPKLVMGRLH